MISAPLGVGDIMTGEILWAVTKGLFFSLAVILVETAFGLILFKALSHRS